jgi:serine/threonine-protein kinase
VAVPDVHGLTWPNAASIIGEHGLRPDLRVTDHDTVPSGQVIRTEPKAGTMVKSGRTVFVYVSTGPPFQ